MLTLYLILASIAIIITLYKISHKVLYGSWPCGQDLTKPENIILHILYILPTNIIILFGFIVFVLYFLCKKFTTSIKTNDK